MSFLFLWQSCMVESKDNRSRFVPSKNNVVRFTVDAFFFKGTSGQVSQTVVYTFKLFCCLNNQLVIWPRSSSTCTAACLWKVLPQHLQLSPATMTTEREGSNFPQRKKMFSSLLVAKLRTSSSYLFSQMGWAVCIGTCVHLLWVRLQLSCLYGSVFVFSYLKKANFVFKWNSSQQILLQDQNNVDLLCVCV